MSDKPKRFEDWQKVDCNDCTHYWDSSCDGASKGSSVACNSYLAKRSVVIPARLNSLEKRITWLNIGLILNGVALVWHLVLHILGG